MSQATRQYTTLDKHSYLVLWKQKFSLPNILLNVYQSDNQVHGFDYIPSQRRLSSIPCWISQAWPAGFVKIGPITCVLGILHLQRTCPAFPLAAARSTRVSAEDAGNRQNLLWLQHRWLSWFPDCGNSCGKLIKISEVYRKERVVPWLYTRDWVKRVNERWGCYLCHSLGTEAEENEKFQTVQSKSFQVDVWS